MGIKKIQSFIILQFKTYGMLTESHEISFFINLLLINLSQRTPVDIFNQNAYKVLHWIKFTIRFSKLKINRSLNENVGVLQKRQINFVSCMTFISVNQFYDVTIETKKTHNVLQHDFRY